MTMNAYKTTVMTQKAVSRFLEEEGLSHTVLATRILASEIPGLYSVTLNCGNELDDMSKFEVQKKLIKFLTDYFKHEDGIYNFRVEFYEEEDSDTLKLQKTTLPEFIKRKPLTFFDPTVSRDCSLYTATPAYNSVAHGGHAYHDDSLASMLYIMSGFEDGEESGSMKKVPEIRQIYANEKSPVVVVEFDDSTKVRVTNQSDYDISTAVAYAVCKKLYGSTDKFLKDVKLKSMSKKEQDELLDAKEKTRQINEENLARHEKRLKSRETKRIREEAEIASGFRKRPAKKDKEGTNNDE